MACVCNHGNGEKVTGRPWGSLASQSSLIDEFRPGRDPALKNTVGGERGMKRKVVLCPHAHICTHTCRTKYTHTEKRNNNNNFHRKNTENMSCTMMSYMHIA